MTGRERIKTIVAGGTPDRVSFWIGNPHRDTVPIYLDAFGVSTVEELRTLLNDDYRWCVPFTAYKHPEGKPMWDYGLAAFHSHGAEGRFADVESVQEIEDAEWPDPNYLDLSETIEALRNAGDNYRASSFWCEFFHIAGWFFGMENYFMKMMTHPEVVHALTRKVIDFLLEGNRRLYEQAGDLIDGAFFGNDFGTQLDLLVGPPQFREFIKPYYKELVDQAHSYDYQVILHCCGAVYKVIPDFVEIGVNALHPLQAKAANMDADTLAREFRGQIAFIGGIDTQDLLVNGTPDDIRADVRRVKSLLGPNLVVSPSHEALLPNVPPENVRAMSEATLDD